MFRLNQWRKSLKACLISLFLTLLVGCSMLGGVVKTYEGPELADEQLAILVAPENITLQSVNGKEVSSYLLSNLETRYGLKDGLNHIVFKYESLWATPGARSSGGSRSEKAQSELMQISLNAQAGKTYSFLFDEVDNIREARDLAKNFSTWVVENDGTRVIESELYQEKEYSERVASASVVSSPVSTSQVLAESNLAALKKLWESTNVKDRKAFLAWAFKE